MKISATVSAIFVAVLWSTVTGAAAIMEDLPSNGVTHLDSPDGRYEVALSDTDKPYIYWLTITDHGRQLARYHFEGQLSSSFWSQDGKYLAINNHDGHRSWHVWVMDLRTGAIIRKTGRTKARSYDAYSGADNLPDVVGHAKKRLQKLAPGIDDYLAYHGNGWPVTVAYGWKSHGRLKMFTELISNTLADKENTKIVLTSLCQVSTGRWQVIHIQGQKVELEAGYPTEVEGWFP